MVKKEEAMIENNVEQQVVASDPADLIPKLATKITLSGSAKNGNLILTFLFELPTQKPIVISRIILDREAASGLQKVLKDHTKE